MNYICKYLTHSLLFQEYQLLNCAKMGGPAII